MKVLFTNHHFGVEIMWTDRGYDQARGWLLILALYMGSNLGRCKTKIKKVTLIWRPRHILMDLLGEVLQCTWRFHPLAQLRDISHSHQLPWPCEKKMWEAMNYCTYRARWKDTRSEQCMPKWVGWQVSGKSSFFQKQSLFPSGPLRRTPIASSALVRRISAFFKLDRSLRSHQVFQNGRFGSQNPRYFGLDILDILSNTTTRSIGPLDQSPWASGLGAHVYLRSAVELHLLSVNRGTWVSNSWNFVLNPKGGFQKACMMGPWNDWGFGFCSQSSSEVMHLYIVFLNFV